MELELQREIIYHLPTIQRISAYYINQSTPTITSCTEYEFSIEDSLKKLYDMDNTLYNYVILDGPKKKTKKISEKKSVILEDINEQLIKDLPLDSSDSDSSDFSDKNDSEESEESELSLSDSLDDSDSEFSS